MSVREPATQAEIAALKALGWADPGQYDWFARCVLDAYRAGFRDGSKQTQLQQAAELIISTQFPSPSMLQRKLKVNYARAAALMDELERIGVVGPPQGHRPRNVLIAEDRLVEFMATMAGGAP